MKGLNGIVLGLSLLLLLQFRHVFAFNPSLFLRQESLTVSTDGKCGGDTDQTCIGSEFGDCCSTTGWCGSESSYCGTGCQTDFGSCASSSTSSDGSCGGSGSISCLGSDFGNCCSARGYCGDNSSYCGNGCQSDFGSCLDASVSSDGSCGGSDGITCQGSDYGNCCSPRGYCGSNSSYCGSGCQTDFGTCFSATDAAATTPTTPTTSTASTDTGDLENPAGSTGSRPSAGMIAGIVIAAVAGVALLGFAMFFFWRRHRSEPPTDDQTNPSELGQGQQWAHRSLDADIKEMSEASATHELSSHRSYRQELPGIGGWNEKGMYNDSMAELPAEYLGMDLKR